MNYVTILDPDELFISILQLNPPQITSTMNLPLGIISFVSDITQHITKQTIDYKALRKILTEKKGNYKASLSSINLEILFSFDLLQTLLAVTFSDDDSLYAAIYITLFIYIKTVSIGNYSDISLLSLFESLRKFSVIQIKVLRPLVLSSFINLYTFFLLSNTTDSYESINQYVFQFYSKNSDLPPDSYLILGNAAQQLFDMNMHTITQPEIEFFSFIDICARERGTAFPSEVIESCIECMSLRLNQLDLFAITFFSKFADRIKTKFICEYYEVFPLAFLNFISSEQPKTLLNLDEIEPIPPLKHLLESGFEFGFKKVKNDEIDFESAYLLPERQPIKDFIRPEFVSRIDLLIRAIEPNLIVIKKYINSYTNVLMEMKKSPYIYDITAIFFESISHYLPTYDIQTVFQMLTQSPIFDPRLNFMNQNNEYQIISHFRACAFDFFAQNNLLSNFIESTIAQPVLLAEHLQRIIQSNIVLNNEQKMRVVKSSINAELIYRKSKNEHDDSVKVARALIFVLLSRFLATPTFSVEFFNDNLFSTVFFLSFLFQPSLKSFVLSSTRDVLMLDSPVHHKVIKNIGNAIDVISNSFPNSEAIQLLIELLNMVITVGSNKLNIVDVLGKLKTHVATSLSILSTKLNNQSQEKELIDLFIKCIQFFTVTSSSSTKTTTVHITSFHNLSTRIFKHEIPSVIFGKFIQLLSGSITPSISPNFIIREPKFCTYFLDFFSVSDELQLQSLDFMNQLVNFTRNNCISCHKGKLDLYLINLLNQMKTQYNDQIVKLALSLFCSITTILSSVTVVHHCFSLFTPIDNVFISSLQSTFIKTFSYIINKTGRNPSASFPLLSNGEKVVCTFDSMNDGIAFLFWIYLDNLNDNYLPSIFNLSVNNFKMNLYLKSNHFVVETRNRLSKSTGICDKTIPLHTWSFVVFNYVIPKSYVELFVNGKSLKILPFPPQNIPKGPIKIEVGGTMENSMDSDQPSLLASFGLFSSLNSSEILSICELGPRIKEIPSTIDKKLIFFIKTTNNDNELKLVPINQYNFFNSMKKVKQNPNFTDVLIRSVKIENLIPLFSQYNLNYYNSTELSYSNDCIDLALLILSSSLNSSVEAQKSMFESNGFYIINHLLSSSKKFTYSMYLSFFSLFQALSLNDLQEQLFNSILFKFDLLFKSNENDHLLILKHWSRTLFPIVLSSKIFVKFQNVMMAFVSYYMNNDSYKKEYKKYMIEIAYQTFWHDQNSDFLLELICIYNNNHLLDLFINLIKSNHSFHISDQSKILNLFLLVNENYRIIELLSLMIQHHIFVDINLNEMTDIILHMFSFSDKLLLPNLFDIMQSGIFELFPLCFYVAFSLGVDHLDIFISSLEPSNNFTKTSDWCFWPIYSIYKMQSNHLIDNAQYIETVKEKTVTFLINSLKCNQIEDFLYMIDLIGALLSCNSEMLKYNALTLIVDKLLKSDYELNECEIILDLVFKFVFFRTHYSKNLKKMFNQSVFKTKNKQHELLSKSTGHLYSERNQSNFFKKIKLIQKSEINTKDVYDYLHNYGFDVVEYKFGLRFDQTSEWEDATLCESAIILFLKKIGIDTISLLNSLLIVSSFLIRKFSDKYLSLIETLISVISKYEETKPFLHYLNYSKSMSKIEYPVYSIDNSVGTCLDVFSRSFNFDRKKQLIKELSLFYENNYQSSLKIFELHKSLSLLKDDIHLISERYQIDNKNEQKEYAKNWTHLWRSLAFNQRSPWHDDKKQYVIHFKRDFSYCVDTIPVKLKRNWNMLEHKTVYSSQEQSLVIEKKSLFTSLNLGKLKEQFKCELIKVSKSYLGIFSLYSDAFQFSSEEKTITFHLSDIRYIFLRNRIHLATAIEVFLLNGKSYFLNFLEKTNVQIVSKISKSQMINLRQIQLNDMFSFFKANSKTEQWQKGEISNFDYLMHLNLMSGRSFNDLSQYPIFPWILCDYLSSELDLNDPNSFRDLSKPIGSHNPKKLANLKKKALELKEVEDMEYLYQSGFMHQDIVIDFLVRLEPFTSLHVKAHRQSFDYSLRTFKSIESSWNKVLTSAAENGELIPEFYCMPEFLINFEKFVNSSKDDSVVNDIGLPPWAKSPLDFIYKMRKALESDIATEKLNEWIDLIWGYKQYSSEDNNTYLPLLYQNVWDSNDYDESLKSIILNVGQIPIQLFSAPHPKKFNPKINPKLFILEHKLDIQHIQKVFFSYNNSKLTIVLIPKTFTRIHLVNLNKKINPSCGQTKITQAFDVNYTIRDLKKKMVDSFFDNKIIYSFVKPSTIVFSVYGSTEISFVNISNGHYFEIETPLNETASIHSEIDHIVISSLNSVVNVYQSQDGRDESVLKLTKSSSSDSFYHHAKSFVQIGSIPSYSSKIPCVQLSEGFNLIVNGTKDGSIVISSLTNLSIQHTIQLENNAKPIDIKISPNWGFIVVYAVCFLTNTKCFFIFTINGKLINKIEIDCEVISMITYGDSSSFDHLAYVDNEENLYETEIYNFCANEPKFKFPRQIVGFTYNKIDKCFVGVSEDGNVYMCFT